MTDFRYEGSELELFANVIRWKSYWSSRCSLFIGGDVLEVGAGIGANTGFLMSAPHRSWTCLEPDASLTSRIEERIAKDGGTTAFKVVVGSTEDLDTARSYDTLIYADVLEHIEDDLAEVNRAGALLREGGKLIVVAPAHEFLFTPFDHAIGHFRRYRARDHARLTIECLELVRVEYLDAVGLLASLANRALLRQSMPTAQQLAFWDSVLVPCSRVLDPLLLRRVGKTVLFVWKRLA